MTHACLTKLSSKARKPSALKDGYQVTGYYVRPLTVGERFKVLRYDRNGVQVLGVLTTNPVVRLTPKGFETQNSRYRLRILPSA